MITPRHLGGHLNRTHIDHGALAWLTAHSAARSLVDVGCGPGGMAPLARSLGLEYFGIDGDPALNLDVPHVIHDYTTGPFVCDRIYDIGWSVEFVEHVEARHIDNFMQTFACCRWVLLTHALPGKRGHHHVNCRPPEYWTDIFASAGLIQNAAATAEVRRRSTMKREFVRRTGLVFRNELLTGLGSTASE